MLRSLVPDIGRKERGQTEPIVALVAVAIFALAISMYAGFITNPLAEGDDRNVAKATLDPVWAELNDAGVYKQSKSLDDITAVSGGSPGTDPDTLPEGRYVYVNISYVGDSGPTPVSAPGGGAKREAVFNPVGERQPSTISEIEDRGFPDNAAKASRAVPIQYGDGDVRAGRLYVIVWQS